MLMETLYDYCPVCQDIMEYDYELECSVCTHCNVTVPEAQATPAPSAEGGE